MFSNSRQLNNATHASYLHQLDAMSELACGACDSWSKLMGRNLALAKNALTDVSVTAEKLMAAQDVRQWMAVSKAHAKPMLNRTLSYCRDINSLTATTHAGLIQQTHAVVQAGSRTANTLLDCLSEKTPAQAGNAVGLAKSLLGQTKAGYEEITRAAQQANGVLEGLLSAVSEQITQALEKSVNVIAED